MRFGRVHRLMTDALASLGLLSLLSSGGLERYAVIALGVGLVAAMSVPEAFQHRRAAERLSVWGSLALLTVQTARLFWGFDALQVAVEFAAGLQVVRIATRRGAAHDQQIVLLALLHLIAGTVLGGGMAYGLCFVGFLVIAPGALVLSHLRREVEGNYRQGARDRSGLPVDVPRILRSRRVVSRNFLLVTCSLAIPIFVFTAVLFVFFPRVGLSMLLLNQTRGERMVGFSDQVDLGKVGALRTDATVALRVFFKDLVPDPPQRIPLYLRGTAFDSYDGVTWRRDRTQGPVESLADRVWVESMLAPVGPELMTIDLEPIRPPVLFLPSEAAAFDLIDSAEKPTSMVTRITRGREGDFEYLRGDERGLRYRVFRADGPAPLRTLSTNDRARYTSLPPGLPDRISDLARRWAGNATQSLEVARRVEERLRTDYLYDLGSPSGAATNPLDHFLFESKRGHCEFYSTSMAVMLRTLGVPTRNVTGFLGASYNRFGRFYVVRQGEAHSWVEVYVDGAGWVRFDPTPSGAAAPVARVEGLMATVRDFFEAASERWDRHVVGYDLDQQMQLLNKVRGALRGKGGDQRWLEGVSPREVGLALALLGGIALAIWAWRRRRRGTRPGRRAIEAPDARIVLLYHQLEDVLRLWGMPRGVGTPPLAHARAVVGLKHPQAAEVLQLTTVYLDVRFGNAEFTEEAYEDFARRVARLKDYRAPAAA